jgi:LemA protein
MGVLGYMALTAFAALAAWGIVVYNRLVRLKHNVRASWSNIDVLLKQRHDELPKLVAICKEYMRHEQETLERVTRARAQVAVALEHEDVGELGAAETVLRQGLARLFAVSESYPDLKANETFRHLQGRISELENTIADRREFYNDAANINNIRIEEFPDLFIARTFGFKPAALLRFEESALKDVDLQALFKRS